MRGVLSLMLVRLCDALLIDIGTCAPSSCPSACGADILAIFPSTRLFTRPLALSLSLSINSYTGKAQIIGMIFLAEIISESAGTHYTKGGPLPTMIFPPVDFSGVDADVLLKKRSSELNNGRLAMIAIMSFCAAANIPGAVPALVGNPMF
jgi:hypothetical protein